MGTTSHYEKYNAWSIGDTKLDWYGVETGQGVYTRVNPLPALRWHGLQINKLKLDTSH